MDITMSGDLGSAVFVVVFYAIYLGAFAVIGIGALASWILNGIGYMKIASHRGVRYGWTAFIPMADWIAVGALASDSEAREGKEPKKWIKWLGIMLGAYFGIYALFIVSYIAFVVVMMIVCFAGASTNNVVLSVLPTVIFLAYFAFVCVLYIFMYSIVFGNLILKGICNFKIFESILGEKALLYFVLSITIPLAQGILLVKCANILKDGDSDGEDEDEDSDNLLDEGLTDADAVDGAKDLCAADDTE